MKKLLTIVCILFSLSLCAQKESSFKDRLFFGGDIALSFSSNATIVGAAPLVGYRITDKWAAGVGVSYYYFKVRFGTFENSTSLYGGNVFTRVLITDNLFAQSEFHIVNTDAIDYDPVTDTAQIVRRNVPLWYVGGGYRQPLGGRAFMSITILYDLIDDLNSPYQNPVIRGGLIFGL